MIPEELKEKIKAGAKVRVYEEKTSPFEGIVIARRHGREVGATFTVRGIIQGLGVEKVYPLHTPAITKFEVISSPKKVSRSKLYYTRHISGSRIRQKLGVSI